MGVICTISFRFADILAALKGEGSNLFTPLQSPKRAMARACLEEFDGEENHVHLLVRYPPKVSIALLARRLKGLLVKL